MRPDRIATFAKSTASTFLCLVLGACGSLNVTMEVLDPQVVQEAANQSLIDTGLSVVLATTPDTITAVVLRAKNEHFQVYVKLASIYEAEAKALVGSPRRAAR